MNLKEYAKAHNDLDTIISKWSGFANAYSLNAEICLQEKDTVTAAKWLDKSLEIDPYDGNAWTARAFISLARKEWKDADKFLSKAIHLKPKVVSNYVNRALARYNYNNLRGAMEDYDRAIDFDPNNFLAHYNRGQLRMQLGDDNRAIADFDYVIHMEPENYLAIFNRALLHDRTGDLKSAIRDYSTVISQFPNFWTGLSYRAKAYRRLGMTAKAEMDEFRILKAQMDKHLGIQPRWSKNKRREMRKRSEIDPEKYNRMVVADENVANQEYKSAFRGKVQNRSVEVEFMPMYTLSFFKYNNGVTSYQAFDRDVEKFNALQTKSKIDYKLYVTCNPPQLTEGQSQAFFQLADSLSSFIEKAPHVTDVKRQLMMRAVVYGVVQDFDAAINDLTVLVHTDSLSTMAYWQRAVCQHLVNEFDRTHGVQTSDAPARVMRVRTDLDAYLYYNRGNLHASNGEYSNAIDDYTRALQIDAYLAEAYYNRGLAYVKNGKKADGIRDLSRAGELGIYDAYSVIKQISNDK